MKSEIDEWDYYYADAITCPYCGHKHLDSWEYDANDGDLIEIDCNDCEASFFVECHVDTTYTSRKAGKENENSNDQSSDGVGTLRGMASRADRGGGVQGPD